MPEPSMQDLADKIDDVARLIARQATTLGQLADMPAPQGPDVPLLVDLHALRGDTLACAVTARSRRERTAFTALADRLERLLTGRGGQVVTPIQGEPFSPTTMEAVEIVETKDEEQDRTVAALLESGLTAAGRSIRPARVAVHRHRS